MIQKSRKRRSGLRSGILSAILAVSVSLMLTCSFVPSAALSVALASPAASEREDGAPALIAEACELASKMAMLDEGDPATLPGDEAPDPGTQPDPEPEPTPTPTPEPTPTPTPTPTPEPDPTPTPTPTPPSSNLQVKELFLKWSSDYGGANEFVGKGETIEVIEIMKKGQLVKLNAYYLDTSGSGVMEECDSSTTELGAIPLKFTSSNTDVATVDPLSGLVTPRGNGTVTITCEVSNPEKYGSAKTEVNMIIDGQEGEYVGHVEITNDAGEVITDTIYIESDGRAPEYYQLHVKIFWVDADGNPTREEWSGGSAISTSVVWETGGSSSCLYVNKDTGRVATQEAGIGSVVVNVAGGVGGRSVSDTVFFFVDTGQTGYNPADSLTLNFSYEDYRDQVVKSITWSVDELAALLPQETHDYTIIGGTRWGTIRATGYKFLDIINLANKELNVFVDFDDVLQFRFGTADAYDSPVSASYLFGTPRYYFPNYDIGYTQGAVVVPPLLATASNVYWNQSYVNPNDELSIGTRFRLVFGVSGASDSNTSKQVYYINSIDIVIKGSPPFEFDPSANGSGGDGSGEGNGAGSGGGSGGGTGTGTGAGFGSTDDGSGSVDDAAGLGDDNPHAGTAQAGGGGGAGGDGGSGDRGWRYYQTMIDSATDLGDIDLDPNPLSPFALPGAVLALLGGGSSMFVGYKRRLY